MKASIAAKHLNDSIKLVRNGAAQLLLGMDENILVGIDGIQVDNLMQEFESTLYANADFSNGRIQLGDYHTQKGDYYKAIEHYKMALKKDSLLTPVYSNLATTFAVIKDYNSAKETLNTWIKLEPKQGRPHYLKALLLYETGEVSAAISEFEYAIKLDPNDTRSMYNLATYYYQSNKDLKRAQKYINDALKIDSNNNDYKYLLALIYQNLGQIDKAQRIMMELQTTQTNK